MRDGLGSVGKGIALHRADKSLNKGVELGYGVKCSNLRICPKSYIVPWE